MDANISVVVTTYNDENEINELLTLLDNQELKPKEIVVADGGSTDSTVKILESYQKRSPIPVKVMAGKRLNISQGLNTAIKASNQPYIAIMATGNKYSTDFLHKLYEGMIVNNADISYCPLRCNVKNSFQEKYNVNLMNNGEGTRYPSNHGILIKREVYKRIGLYYEYFVYAGEDTEFILRVQNDGGFIVHCVDEVFVEWTPPGTIKQFNKQIRTYTIAGLQINPLSKVVRGWKNCIIDVFSLILLICGISIHIIGLSILAILIFVFNHVRKVPGKLIFNWMILYKNWYSLFVAINNIKYLSNEEHFNKDRINYL